jgi:DNA invertase Pin-like site-specific DNA recombinase
MQYNEVKGIAKSIARWVWKRDGYAYQEFIDRQTRKGALGGLKGGKVRSAQYDAKRKQAGRLKAKGMSNTALAEKLNVARYTVIRWLNEVSQ